ncbi:MAG: hypothetical protein ACJAT4_000636 [Granulosicoccus sp.]|jgi:hypothetical protein
MKKLLTSLFMIAAVMMVSNSTMAQISTPAPSPGCKMEQVVGLTTVELDYSRPSVKGRTLFVDVEAFGSIWRTGANGATKITFSDDVKIEGNAVPAGTYALYSIPDPVDWTIMLYKDLTIGGNVSKYNEEDELARFKVKGYKRSNFVESFTIDIADVKADGATMSLKWGNWYVPFKLEVSYDDQVMGQIESAMAGTTRGEFYSAAKYYYDNGKDMKKAHEWATVANQKGERYWQLRLQAQIEAKLGMKKEAMVTMGKSSAVAKAAGSAGYAKANDKIMEGF